jgi:hypothetical protein
MTGLPEWLRTVYTVLLLIGVAASWGFVARYTTTYRWWKDVMGVHLITFSTIVGLFFSYFAVLVIWPGLPGKTAIRTVLFIALTATIVWRLFIFERVRHQDRKTSTNPEERS